MSDLDGRASRAPQPSIGPAPGPDPTRPAPGRAAATDALPGQREAPDVEATLPAIRVESGMFEASIELTLEPRDEGDGALDAGVGGSELDLRGREPEAQPPRPRSRRGRRTVREAERSALRRAVERHVTTSLAHVDADAVSLEIPGWPTIAVDLGAAVGAGGAEMSATASADLTSWAAQQGIALDGVAVKAALTITLALRPEEIGAVLMARSLARELAGAADELGRGAEQVSRLEDELRGLRQRRGVLERTGAARGAEWRRLNEAIDPLERQLRDAKGATRGARTRFDAVAKRLDGAARKVSGPAGKLLKKALGTTVSKALSRLVPYVGWGLLAWDAFDLVRSMWAWFGEDRNHGGRGEGKDGEDAGAGSGPADGEIADGADAVAPVDGASTEGAAEGAAAARPDPAAALHPAARAVLDTVTMIATIGEVDPSFYEALGELVPVELAGEPLAEVLETLRGLRRGVGTAEGTLSVVAQVLAGAPPAAAAAPDLTPRRRETAGDGDRRRAGAAPEADPDAPTRLPLAKLVAMVDGRLALDAVAVEAILGHPFVLADGRRGAIARLELEGGRDNRGTADEPFVPFAIAAEIDLGDGGRERVVQRGAHAPGKDGSGEVMRHLGGDVQAAIAAQLEVAVEGERVSVTAGGGIRLPELDAEIESATEVREGRVEVPGVRRILQVDVKLRPTRVADGVWLPTSRGTYERVRVDQPISVRMVRTESFD